MTLVWAKKIFFSDMTSKAHVIRENFDKLDFIEV